MQPSVSLGRIAGVKVGINWSWLIVVALVVWSLAEGVFPETNPGLSDGTYIAMAAVAAVAFFLSLFLHEMGHAQQARREGMEIEGITLWVFGGVAQFRGMFPSAGAEFRIAIAGPLVSLAIGAVCLAVALAVPLPDAVDGVVFWLGYINLFLLAFNMLPALPLDGGRVLRSLLWARKGDFTSATQTAAALGRAFGQVMIGGGVFLVIFVGAIGGVWLAFIGWFLLMAAEQEGSLAEVRVALEGLRVRDVMVTHPVCVDADLPVDRFIDEVFFRHRHTAYPVTEDGEWVGIVSFRHAAEGPREEWARVRVRDRMIPRADALGLDADADLSEALPELAQTSIRRALVFEHGRPAGLLSMTDAMRVLELRGGRLGARAAAEGVVPPAEGAGRDPRRSS
jgi:Zn-dependent protease